jgi:hypothetical protein
MEPDFRTRLSQRAADLGFDSAQALLRYVSKAIIDGRSVTFGQSKERWGTPPAHVMERWEKEIEEHEVDKRAGKVKSYTDVDDLMKDLLADEED